MDVSFNHYNSADRIIRMFLGPELKELMDESTDRLQVFTDIKWLIYRTGDFFRTFESRVKYHPMPLSYEPSILVKRMKISE